MRLRILKSVLGAVLVVVVVIKSRGLLAGLGDLRRPDPRWLGIAIGLEVASLLAYAGMVQQLLGLGGVTARIGALLRPTLAGIAMSASLPAGIGASNIYWYKKLRQQQADRGLAAVVLSGTSVAGALALGAMLVVGAAIAGNTGPLACVHRWFLCLGGLFVVVRLGFAHRLGRLLTSLLRRLTPALEIRPGVRVRRLRAVMIFSYANWLFDCAALCISLRAVHSGIPARSVLLVYVLAQLVAQVALLPGGGGTVELSLVACFAAFGHHAGNVLPGVMLYRLISCWGLIPVGWFAVILDPARASAGSLLARRRGLCGDERELQHADPAAVAAGVTEMPGCSARRTAGSEGLPAVDGPMLASTRSSAIRDRQGVVFALGLAAPADESAAVS